MHGIFLKTAFLEIPRSPLLTEVPGLQYKICEDTQSGKFQEVIRNGISYQKLTTCKLHVSVLRVFKTPEVESAVEFLSSEAGANGSSTEKLLQTAIKTFQENLQVYLQVYLKKSS